jgi:hypothetical protein
VIPTRITREIIQMTKMGVGSVPVWEWILLKMTIPIMVTAIVNPMGILIDNFISFILVSLNFEMQKITHHMRWFF